MNKIIFYDPKRTSKTKGIIATMKFLAPDMEFVIVSDINILNNYYSDERNILGYPKFVLAQAIVTDEKIPFHGIPVFPLKDAARALHAKPAYMRTSQYVVKRYTFLSHFGLFKNSGDIQERHLGEITYFTKGKILCIRGLHKPVRIQYTHYFSYGEFCGLMSFIDDNHNTKKFKFSYTEEGGLTLLEPDWNEKPFFFEISDSGSCRKVTYLDLPDFTIGAYNEGGFSCLQ